ncbi:insulinase family protein [Polaribacter vadi]|uniref:M16 family metallopeptidase n=1 Tax=Polaribacter vadi TaxID=1774273 RepID=UPI0030EEA9DB|tara:strand:- start:42716 stop:45517 length:2802 start_codon:yes stop_codon:yes gene_type:complete
MKNNKIQSFLTCLVLFNFQVINSQEVNINTVKPAELTSGKLVNGMHYYIKNNNHPKGKVSFYFAQNVGSILENDKQKGLAHFLEHMAFNGTKNFKGKTMVQYLEKNGVRFGKDINAFTMYDKTVYNINNVTANHEKLLDSILYILSDWSGGLTLADNEIDSERGVVREEWRTRYTPIKRAQDSVKNLGLLKGSKYALRSPIGTMDVINNFKYKELKEYYKKWYRPDLQAIIIVGDIDEQKMERKVKEIFSKIPLPKIKAQRPVFKVSLGDSLTYLTIKDKEITTSTIEFYSKHTKNTDISIKDELKQELKEQFINKILNQRFYQLSEKASSPVYSVRFGFNEIVRPLLATQIKLEPKKDSILTALQLVFTEVSRFKKFGTTEKEFAEAKTSLLRNLRNDLQKENYSNIYLAIELYKTFFKEKPLTDYKWKAQFQIDVLNELTNEDLIAYYNNYENDNGKVLAIIGSDKIKYPIKEEVENVIKTVKTSKLKPFKDVITIRKNLMKLNLKGSRILNKQTLTNDGILYELSNGAKVKWYANFKDSSEKMIHFNAFSLGGRSLLKKDELSNAFYATMVTQASGVANLNQKELRSSGEVITPKVAIDHYEESLQGYASSENLEKLFKGIYLSFEAPRFDEQAFEKTLQDLNRFTSMLKGSVQSALVDSLELAKNGYSEREVHFGKDMLEELSLDKVKTIYLDRIKNASDFTFVFMGNIPEKSFETLIQKYVGSIPGKHSQENFIKQGMKPAVGLNKVHLKREMKTPQTSVHIHIAGDTEYANKNQVLIKVVEQLLAKKYLQRIREEEGGTYGVKVRGNLQHIPDDAYTLDISFNCNPEKTDVLVQIVYEELKKLESTINFAELSEVKSGLISELQGKKKSTQYFFDRLIESLKNDTEFWSDEKVIHQIKLTSIEDVKAFVKKINRKQRIVEGILSPKS